MVRILNCFDEKGNLKLILNSNRTFIELQSSEVEKLRRYFEFKLSDGEGYIELEERRKY